MGSTNHGTQEITYEYFEEATAEDFNKRHLDIRPRGMYKGGYFTRVNDAQITLSTFTAEIGDNDEQISVKTAGAATITTALLDSGNLDSGTPWIVLRWAFVEAQNNYVEIHAIASVADAQANDIIVGKVVFAGAVIQPAFDYTDRTFLNIQDLFFKVETSTGLYVQLRAGRVQDGDQCIIVPEQKVGAFNVPGDPNSRIDLIYIATNGTVTILQGTPAVSPSAPNHTGRLVVAEVKIVNGDASIPADRITDVRNFLTPFVIPDDTTIERNSSGKLRVKSIANQFTPSSYTGGESVTFPNNFVLKSGSRVGSGSVVFGTAFPNDVKRILLTPKHAHNHYETPVYHSESKTGFIIDAGGSFASANIDWLAIGY